MSGHGFHAGTARLRSGFRLALLLFTHQHLKSFDLSVSVPQLHTLLLKLGLYSLFIFLSGDLKNVQMVLGKRHHILLP